MNVEELFDLAYGRAWRGFEASRSKLDPSKIRMTRDGLPIAALTLYEGVVSMVEGTNFHPKTDRPLLHELGNLFKEKGAKLVYSESYS